MEFKLYQEYFKDNLELDIAKELFKVSVGHIEIAVTNYCNRKCNYCPNSLIDSSSTIEYMNDDVFFNVLTQLKQISYSGSLSLHRYNEPLADLEYLVSRIKYINSFLPNANICIYTNGDYLDTMVLQLLETSGVGSLIVTFHHNQPQSADVLNLFKHKLAMLMIPAVFSMENDGKIYKANAQYGKMSITYQLVDFYAQKDDGSIYAHDRGGLFSLNSTYQRTAPCLMPFMQMQIEYDGSLLPCCNIHPGIEAHKKYIIGKIDGNNSIFKEWTNINYVEWRKHLICVGPKKIPCNKCNMNA